MTVVTIARKSRAFYDTLKTLVRDGALSIEHPLVICPVDPFSAGQTHQEKRAIQELHNLCGNWSYDLRCLYYGFVQSGRRISNLHAGIGTLTIYDEELRTLLRSHPGDERLFPRVFFPDELAESRFREVIYGMDRTDAWRLPVLISCTDKGLSS